MGLKITPILRNKKLEKELQSKIMDIISDPKYDTVSMLFINACRIRNTKNAFLDISYEKCYFVITRNEFMADKKIK